MEQIARETFFAACFLPCHYDMASQGLSLEVIVQHPSIQDKIDYLVKNAIPQTLGNKHLSVNRMKISYKQLKKVK